MFSQLELVAPIITKKTTKFREPISASQRLAVTLRFLATGESYRSLQYMFRIPHNTISGIIPEVCDAIYKVLQPDYLKVFYILFISQFITLLLIGTIYQRGVE